MAASPQDVETDAVLVMAAQDGDADAFSELFRRHYPTVRRVCARKLRDLREADEIAQAAFVRAYERLDKCNGDRRFGAWVQVIANNLCIDHMRASARTTPVGEPVDENETGGPTTPEDALMNAEQAAMIQRALASLPDRQRDVVVARDMDGRRPPEIAAALGLSLGAVDSLLLRARRRLAASVQSMSAESGAASFVTTAAVTAAGSTAANLGTIGRVAQSLNEVAASVSYHVASSLGMVPGVPSLVAQAAPVAAVGLLSLNPGAHHIPKDIAPLIAPVTAEVPLPVPSLLPTLLPVTEGLLTTTAGGASDLVEPVASLDVPGVDAEAVPLQTPGVLAKVANLLGQLTRR